MINPGFRPDWRCAILREESKIRILRLRKADLRLRTARESFKIKVLNSAVHARTGSSKKSSAGSRSEFYGQEEQSRDRRIDRILLDGIQPFFSRTVLDNDSINPCISRIFSSGPLRTACCVQEKVREALISSKDHFLCKENRILRDPGIRSPMRRPCFFIPLLFLCLCDYVYAFMHRFFFARIVRYIN